MKMLVTGSSGFIGSNLIESALDKGIHVTGIDQVGPKHRGFRPPTEFYLGDVRDEAFMRSVVLDVRPAYIVHLAARTDMVDGDVETLYSTNTEGVRVVAGVALDAGTRRTLFASSRLVFDPQKVPVHRLDYSPSTTYGRSKVIGEAHVLKYAREIRSRRFVIARPTSIWGPGFDVPYAQFFAAVSKGSYVHPRGINSIKSFGYVKNIVEQIHLIGDSESLPDFPVWLSDVEPIEIGGFADEIRRALGYAPVRRIDRRMLSCCARIGDLLKKVGAERAFPLNSSRLVNLTCDTVYDMDIERSLYANLGVHGLGYGIQDTLAWWKVYGRGVRVSSPAALPSGRVTDLNTKEIENR